MRRCPIGEAVFRGKKQRFGILTDDRRRHLYLVGKTGQGKSALLENMIFADVQAGNGVAVLDPHGDLADAVLRMIPKHRTNDVILLDPSDEEFPFAFNVLSCPPQQRALAASGVVSTLAKLFPGVWSSRMEHILRNCLLSLLEAEGQSLLGVSRILVDVPFRQKILAKTTDPIVRAFWTEYESWTERYRSEAIAAVLNKVGQLLSTPLLRNILGQTALKVDFRHAMDSGKIVLANLSKGKLGEDASSFIGSLLVTRFQLAAMSRADVPEQDRRDFGIYADEFQNLISDSFTQMLSELRKFRVGMTLPSQYLGQLRTVDGSTAVRDAVFGNIGSILCFQISPEDAEFLSTQFEGLVSPRDLINLPRYHAYMRLLVHGHPSKPFSLQTLPPPVSPPEEGREDLIRRLSRQRYATPRKEVEAKIGRWLGAEKKEPRKNR